MWLIALIMTLVLWMVLDNFLIAAIVAIFGVYSFALVRALVLVKRNKIEK